MAGKATGDIKETKLPSPIPSREIRFDTSRLTLILLNVSETAASIIDPAISLAARPSRTARDWKSSSGPAGAGTAGRQTLSGVVDASRTSRWRSSATLVSARLT